MNVNKSDVSNCCYAPILTADTQGHGTCSECKENCVPDVPDVQNRIVELSTNMGRLREGQFVEYKRDGSCQVYSIVDTQNIEIFYPSEDGVCIRVKIEDISF